MSRDAKIHTVAFTVEEYPEDPTQRDEPRFIAYRKCDYERLERGTLGGAVHGHGHSISEAILDLLQHVAREDE